VIYNAAWPSTALQGETTRRQLAGTVPLADWWQGRPADPAGLKALARREVWAAAGMADPERFFRMLEAEGLRLKRCPLPDHYAYHSLPWPADATDVLVTEKDAVKLHPERMGQARIWVVTLDLSLPPSLLPALAQHLLPPAPPSAS
jgi:tetraacyldisaccharide 4'-kinase